MVRQSSISYWNLPEAVQDIFIRQRTGSLSLRIGDRREQFLFLSGQLYLLPSSPCYERLTEILVGPRDGYEDARFDAAKYLSSELGLLVRDLVEEMSEWEVSELHFEETEAEVSEDIVGPVPTGVLVMDFCSRGSSETELLRRLGGLDSRYRAGDSNLRCRVPELDQGEIGLLDRLESAADVRTLIAEAGGRASEVLCNLTRLVSVRLVESESDLEPAKGVLSPELLESISTRVRESLNSKPLEMEPDRHRAWLSKMLQDYGRQSHFELLGVDSESPIKEIHHRYMELARAVHPSHAENLGFRNRKRSRQLEWLFARLTEAYLVLSDPDRAAEYRRGLSEVPTPRAPEPLTQERRVERSRLGRQNYLLALEYVDVDDYHYAIELLRQAVTADPLPEYHALLADCLRRNPHWLHMAVDSYREAVAQRPGDPELRALLEEVTDEFRRHAAHTAAKSASPPEEGGPDEGLGQRLIAKFKRRERPPES